MGFLSRLLGSEDTSQIEAHIVRIYVPLLLERCEDLPSELAERMVRQFMRVANRESSRAGTNRLPANFTEQIVHSAQPSVQRKRTEGVRATDFRWWWGMHDLERRMIVKVEELSRVALFMGFERQGFNESDAAAWLRKATVTYGDPDDTTHTSGEDAPLPWELWKRATDWCRSRQKQSPIWFARDMEASTTLNAIIRREIRQGTL